MTSVEPERRTSETLAAASISPTGASPERTALELVTELVASPDLACSLNLINCAGQLYDLVSGTSEGRKIELRRSSWDEGVTWFYRGTADAEAMPKEEAQAFWEKIHPALVAIDKIQRDQAEAICQQNHEQSVAINKLKEEVGEAYKRGLEEGERIGKVRGILEYRLTEIEINEADRNFIDEAVKAISKLYQKKTEGSPATNKVFTLKRFEMGSFDSSESSKLAAEYDRRAAVLKKLLGANEPIRWVAGFGNQYVHSIVHDTILSDTILRECYDRQELGTAVAQMTIERNCHVPHIGNRYDPTNWEPV